jgi:2-haloacid dehalogenase
VPKERIGFVTSNFWDAAGAKSFGFTVYWINRGGAAAERLGFQPDRVLKSLAGL